MGKRSAARKNKPKNRKRTGPASPPHPPHQTAAQEIATDHTELTSATSMADSIETQEKTLKEIKGDDTRTASHTADTAVITGDDEKTVPSKVAAIPSSSNLVVPKMPTPEELVAAGIPEVVELTSTPEPTSAPSTRSNTDSMSVVPPSNENQAAAKASQTTKPLESLDLKADDIEKLTLSSTPEASLDSSNALVSQASPTLEDTGLDSTSDLSLGSDGLPSTSLTATLTPALNVNAKLSSDNGSTSFAELPKVSFGSTSQVGYGHFGGLFTTSPPMVPAKSMFSTLPLPLSPASFAELAGKACASTSKVSSGSSGGLFSTSPSTPLSTPFATLAEAAPASPPSVSTNRSGREKKPLKQRKTFSAKLAAAAGHDQKTHARHVLAPNPCSSIESVSTTSKSALPASPLPELKATATEFAFRAAPLPKVKAVAIPSSFKFDHPEMQKPAKDVTLGNPGKAALTSTATPAPAPRGQVYFGSLPQTSDFAFQGSSNPGPRRIPKVSPAILGTASDAKIGALDKASHEIQEQLPVFPSSVRLRPPRSRASASSALKAETLISISNVSSGSSGGLPSAVSLSPFTYIFGSPDASPSPFTYILGSPDASPPTSTSAVEDTALSSVNPSIYPFRAPTTSGLFDGFHSKPLCAPPSPSVLADLPAYIFPGRLTFLFANRTNPLSGSQSKPLFANCSKPRGSQSKPLFVNQSKPLFGNESKPHFADCSNPLFGNESRSALAFPSTSSFVSPFMYHFVSPPVSLFTLKNTAPATEFAKHCHSGSLASTTSPAKTPPLDINPGENSSTNATLTDPKSTQDPKSPPALPSCSSHSSHALIRKTRYWIECFGTEPSAGHVGKDSHLAR
jgi:hypothetical protein